MRDFAKLMSFSNGSADLGYKGINLDITTLWHKFKIQNKGIDKKSLDNVIQEHPKGGELFKQAFTLFRVGSVAPHL